MLERTAAALAETEASLWLQESSCAVPALQTLHLIGIGLAFTAAALIASRRLRGEAVTAWSFRSWLWAGLAVVVPSGALLVLAEPDRALLNSLFEAKMALLLAVLALTVPASLTCCSVGMAALTPAKRN